MSHLSRQRFRTYAPILAVTERRGSRFRATNQPLFPGYLFVFLNLTKDNWRPINSTKGVVRILTSNGGLPQSIPTQFVENLLDRSNEDGKFLPMGELPTGVMVKIQNGPFAGINARLDSSNTGERTNLLLTLIGNNIRIKTDRQNLSV